MPKPSSDMLYQQMRVPMPGSHKKRPVHACDGRALVSREDVQMFLTAQSLKGSQRKLRSPLESVPYEQESFSTVGSAPLPGTQHSVVLQKQSSVANVHPVKAEVCDNGLHASPQEPVATTIMHSPGFKDGIAVFAATLADSPDQVDAASISTADDRDASAVSEPVQDGPLLSAEASGAEVSAAGPATEQQHRKHAAAHPASKRASTEQMRTAVVAGYGRASGKLASTVSVSLGPERKDEDPIQQVRQQFDAQVQRALSSTDMHHLRLTRQDSWSRRHQATLSDASQDDLKAALEPLSGTAERASVDSGSSASSAAPVSTEHSDQSASQARDGATEAIFSLRQSDTDGTTSAPTGSDSHASTGDVNRRRSGTARRVSSRDSPEMKAMIDGADSETTWTTQQPELVIRPPESQQELAAAQREHSSKRRSLRWRDLQHDASRE